MTLAFIFDSVGAGEWLLLLAVLLVVMGPKRLPGILRKLGSHYAKFRRAADSFKRQLMEMDTEFERAVNAAEREAEDAARMADITQLNDQPSGAYSSSEEPTPETPAAQTPETPAVQSPETPAAQSAETPAAQSAEPVEPDGNQHTQES